MATSRPPKPMVMPVLVFALACLLQLPLALNPGYYSHDELQWAVHAVDGVRMPWLDVSAFQYRPLTFNLWMRLSRALFDTPMLFHAVLVAAGALNATLLFAVGRGFGMASRPAVIGALAFVLSPYAVYTHGWVGCIADVLWVGCALLLAVCVQRTHHALLSALAAALLTGIALLAKEAAFAIPPLLALAWWFDGRKPKWCWAMLASGAVAALYLGLRLDVLLHAPREGAQYTLSLAHVPQRWLEYQLFPPIVPLHEAITTLQRPLPALVAGLSWLGLLAALWQAGRRFAALFLLGGIAALLPVLPLASAWNHYAYGFAAIAAMTIAATWLQASRRGRIAIGIFALLGFPPFASFLAEMLILSGIVQAGNLMAFTVMCGMLTIIFVSTGRVIFPMLWDAPTRTGPPVVESLVTMLPKLGFVSILIMLGTYAPEPISQLLRAVAVSIGGV